MTTPRFDIQQLLDPSVYPWPVDEVRLIETHISWVLLSGDRVVKLKRPVDLGFVDFRDPATRKKACEDEVRLNRRLTTDVYLGIVPVTANGVDAPGEPLEWATLMRRMPSDRMLDVLLQNGTAPLDLAEQLADRLIQFHHPSSRALPLSSQFPPSSRAKSRDLSLPEHPSPTSTPSPSVIPPSPTFILTSPGVILNEVKDLSRSESPETPPASGHQFNQKQAVPHPRGEILRVAQNDSAGEGEEQGTGLRGTRDPSTSLGMTEGVLGVAECPTESDTYLKVLTDNLDQVADAAGDILAREQLALVDRSMRDFICAERTPLDARFDLWLIEGHGDLRCEHFCFEADAMQIYDCVEFEIAIRCADVASDLAFLLMDLRRLGAQPVADELLERYRSAGFDLPQPVIDLYGAHRALVRAKVAALERTGSDAEHDRAQALEAASYLDIATSFACPTPPMLVLVSGLSGSGKSTVAAALAQATGGMVFASDPVRKELAGLQATDSAAADWHQGIYTDAWTARTYDRLLELAAATLGSGQIALIDATFLDNAQRERFVALARTLDVPAAIVWTALDDAIAKERIARRARERGSASDATMAIRERQIAALKATPVIVPEGALAVIIDTSAAGSFSRDPFFDALDAAGLLGRLARQPEAAHA